MVLQIDFSTRLSSRSLDVRVDPEKGGSRERRIPVQTSQKGKKGGKKGHHSTAGGVRTRSLRIELARSQVRTRAETGAEKGSDNDW